MKKQPQKKKKKGTRKKSTSKSKSNISLVAENRSREVEVETNKKSPQTIAKREPEKRKEEKSIVIRYTNVTIQFLREARTELKMVKWPTRKELLAATAMVIILVLAVSLFLGLVDFGLIRIIKSIVG